MSMRHGSWMLAFLVLTASIVALGQDSPAPDFGRPHPGLPADTLPRPYADKD